MAFDIRTESNEYLKIFLEGDLDINSSPVLKVKSLEAYKADPKDIIFDFTLLKYLDSTGLGALISVYRNVNPKGHSIRIRNAKKHIRKLFHITELDRDFILEGEED